MFTTLQAHNSVLQYNEGRGDLQYMHYPYIGDYKLEDIVNSFNYAGMHIHAWSSHPTGYDLYYTHVTRWSTELGWDVKDTDPQGFDPVFVEDLPYEEEYKYA